MLTITIPALDAFDDATQKFIEKPAVVLHLEHSLVSLSKWEARFEKAFLGREEKTTDEVYGYLEAMVLDEEFDPQDLRRLPKEEFDRINAYIEAKNTATWFSDSTKSGSREIVTAEIIRYWMIALNIPLEYQHSHLNQLFTIIRVVNEKNKPTKKVSRADAAARQRQLNEERLAKLRTRG